MANGSCSEVMLNLTRGHDFAHGLVGQFQVMKDQEYLTDYFLKVKGQQIACHRMVLAAQSTYFHVLFGHKNTVEVTQGFVEFETLDFTAVELVVGYFYSGVLECTMDQAKDVIEMSEYLQIPDLKSDISPLIANHMTADSCIDWYFFAKRYGMTKVQQKAQEKLYLDFSNVVCSSNFLALEYDNLTDYLLWENINHGSALVAATKWITHDVEQRQNKFSDILSVIDIKQCSTSVLKHIIEEYGSQLITKFDVFHKFTAAALSDVTKWQESGPGTGYDVIVLGGHDNMERSAQTWKINLITGDTVEKARLPGQLSPLFAPAMCSTSKGVVIAGGISEEGDWYRSYTQCVLYVKEENMWSVLPRFTNCSLLCKSSVHRH